MLRGISQNTFRLFAATGLGLVFSLVFQASALGAGEGSTTNNPDLLRGAMTPNCYDPVLCGPYAVVNPPPSANAVHVVDQPELKLQGPPPYRRFSPGGDPFPGTDVDWQLSLRGAYRREGSSESFEAVAAPSVSLSHVARGVTFDLNADAEIVGPLQGNARIRNATVSFEGEKAINADTSGKLRASIGLSQASPDDPSLPTGVSIAPVVGSGDVDITLARRYGSFFTELKGSASRDIFSTSGLTAGGWQDNADRNRWGLGAGLRLGNEVSAHIDGFVEGSILRDLYDVPSSAFGVRANSWTYAVRAGLTGNWRETLEGEVSVGYALRRFDVTSTFADAHAVLADAEFTYRPDETVEISTRFGTEISAADPTSGSAARVDYVAGIDARYLINPFLTVRGSLGANWALLFDTGATENGYSAGMGADIAINRHTNITADYTYAISERSSGTSDSHAVALGVTVKR